MKTKGVKFVCSECNFEFGLDYIKSDKVIVNINTPHYRFMKDNRYERVPMYDIITFYCPNCNKFSYTKDFKYGYKYKNYQ